MKMKNAIVAAVIGTGFLFVAQSEAMAWGCLARAKDGAYGYSYNYPNKRSAQNRALKECSIRTYYRCRVVSCDPNG
jgi:hypothetical protein